MSASPTAGAAPGARTLRDRGVCLDAGWQLACCPPDAVLDPDAAAALDWSPPAALGTAAAMLRDAGRWSLDGPPLDFDGNDWWYRLRFDRPDDAGFERGAVLCFDGLATLAQAWLNGRPVLVSDNMHVAHRCAIGDALQPRDNLLVLRFRSVTQALRARRGRPRWRTPMLEEQQLRWVRTTLLGRTPGWSPPCPPVGPWRDVRLEPLDRVRCELLHWQADVDVARAGAARAPVRLALACRIVAPTAPAAVTLELHRVADPRERGAGGDLGAGGDRGSGDDGDSDDDRGAGDPAMAVDVHRVALARTGDAWSATLALPDAVLWWPATHGEPALYRAVLRVDGDTVVELGATGFRSVSVDRDGGRFALSVNGVPVFCRGACWTPLDPVGLRASDAEQHAAVAQVRAAGMNMLRIAGPMVYEDDAFLDACDREGVLLWHDLMFANMDYPQADEAFVAGVDLEVAQQLDRLRLRPSVAVVCGNSEVAQQAAMWGAPRADWHSPLFDERLAAAVAARLPGVAYQPSSAHGGAFPHQVDEGTTSYYGVGAYLRPPEDARRSGLRFATECLAFANVPGAATIARMPGGERLRVGHAAWRARAPRDLGAGWDFEDVRDHYLSSLFGVDPFRLRAVDHDRYLRLSRAATGEAMAAAFAEWRRRDAGCGGALVWLLRDLWAGAGWGLLDDAGVPKACWHRLRRVLQPRTVLLTDEGNSGLRVHVVNERAQPLAARLRLGAWRGATSVIEGTLDVEVPPRTTFAVPAAAMLERVADLNDAFRFGPRLHDAVRVTLHEATGPAGGGDAAALAEAWWFPAGPVLPADPGLGLRARAERVDEQTVAVQVDTTGLATGVHFDAPGWVPDDEYFHLAPGDSQRVRLRRIGPAVRSWRGVVHALNADAPTVIGGNA